MRQRDDRHFAEVLNRMRSAHHTPEDLEFLKSRLITEEESIAMPNVPHFFTTNVKKDHYNFLVMENITGTSVTVEAIDIVQSDIPKSEQRKALASATTKPTSATGNLQHTLTVKVGVTYDITANIAPTDGIVNGAECIVRHIEPNTSDGLPQFVWVKFLDENTGKELRRRIRPTFREFVAQNWTPIQPITRTFVATRNNYHILRKQYPLQMSAGRTIHKAQSATHTNIVVDLSGPERAPKTFWQHMHYVALSRCTKLDGLHIIDLNEKMICASDKVTNYLAHQRKLLDLCYTPHYASGDRMSVVYNNVGSIAPKWAAIKNSYHITSANIIFFAETWLKTHHPPDFLSIENFRQVRHDSISKPGHRGMVMFLRDDLPVITIQNYESEAVEMICCIVRCLDKTYAVMGIYKPPSTRQSDFLSEFDIISSRLPTYDHLIVLGDMNINVAGGTSSNFLDHFHQQFRLRQLISSPTTWEGTLIDLVFTDCPLTSASPLTTMWSKHHLLSCTVNNE